MPSKPSRFEASMVEAAGDAWPGARVVSWLLARRYVMFGVALVLAVLAGLRTARTYSAVSSDMMDLLPDSAPSVVALSEARQRLPGVRHLGVIVATGGQENVPAANRFIDALAERLRAQPSELVKAVRTDRRREREFIETYLFQLMDPEDVRELADAAEQRRDWEVTRAMGADLLDDHEEPAPELPLQELTKKYAQRFGFGSAPATDRFVAPDGESVALLVQTGGHTSDYRSDRSLLRRVEREVSALRAQGMLPAGLGVGFAGEVATGVEETEGLQADLTISALLVLLLNVAVIYAFYRSWWVLPIVGVPLLCATACSFAIVALPPMSITTLNSNTAFLGSIIVGNGVNSAIILLARLHEEERRGAGAKAAIVTAVQKTWRATLAAALAASAAYASLIFTDFRGFNQFGWIGGLGLVISWLWAYALIPPLVYELSLRRRGSASVFGAREHGAGLSPSIKVGAWVTGRPRLVVALTVLASVLGGLGLWQRRSDWIEYDLGKLRRRDSWTAGERYWGKRMDAAVGQYLTPTVILTASAEEARVVEERLQRLRREGGAGGVISAVRSATTWLPPRRESALEHARRLRVALTPRIEAALAPRERELVERALGERAAVPLRADDVPQTLLLGLREASGRIDRNVLVLPRLGQAVWDAERLTAFGRDLRRAATIEAEPRPVAGALLLTSDMAATIKADGPRAVGFALLAVLGICLAAFHGRGRSSSVRGALGLSLLAMVSLLTGVMLMLGGLGWLGAKVNFCNFVALPITFGIAADYSINMLRRYQSEAHSPLGRALSSTSGAVTLCSLTTIIGFGSLLMAQNQALFSFGLFAIVGELTCLATAVLALPAGLYLMRRGFSAEPRVASAALRTSASAYRSSPGDSRRPAP
jgi:predicted RND superfamily exporter protein